MASNAPQARPPGAQALVPCSYMRHLNNALITGVTATVTVHSASSLTPGPSKSRRQSTFGSMVAKIPAEAIGAQDEQKIGRTDFASYPPSIYRQSPVKICETSKFNPEEQRKMVLLRKKISRCEEEFRALTDLLQKDSGVASGLPRLSDIDRARYQGHTFSVEDAKRELCHPWLLERLADYGTFVDSALQDKLDRVQVQQKPAKPPAIPFPGLPPGYVAAKPAAVTAAATLVSSDVQDVAEFPGRPQPEDTGASDSKRPNAELPYVRAASSGPPLRSVKAEDRLLGPSRTPRLSSFSCT
eukprot:TRINITY_DN58112_c0_g1_i1.p1 TRINITY_DN58112_c0_g1~~TRINITY_DN58112_c0_g1_i1.p1  ORF type:complete len:318 (-),score=42.53 TRINITY_DN58112_c0_g1_i1:22-918(-)